MQCWQLIEAHDLAAAIPPDPAAATHDQRLSALKCLQVRGSLCPFPFSRGSCLTSSTAQALEEQIQYAVVSWACANSVASYVAAAQLVGDKKQDLLHSVAAIAKEEEGVQNLDLNHKGHPPSAHH